MKENSIEEDIKILEENLKNGTIYVNCGNSIDKALENLLTRYKELEEWKKEKGCSIQEVFELFIPKSKIKEKIEELKNGTYDAKIILQQLLEENTGNHIPRID